MMLRPGMPVKPTPWNPNAKPAAARRRGQRTGEVTAMSRYFIDRPIFAWVHRDHPDAGRRARDPQRCRSRSFPRSRRPRSSITATYPGADAQTLENTTTQIIEQQLKGIDNLRYFSSSSSSAGTVDDHADLRAGHRPRHRAGPGAEQAAGGDAAAAAGGAAAGHPSSPRRRRTSCCSSALYSENGSA